MSGASTDIICLTSVEPGETCSLCGAGHEEHERRWAAWTPPPVDDDYRDRRLTEFLL